MRRHRNSVFVLFLFTSILCFSAQAQITVSYKLEATLDASNPPTYVDVAAYLKGSTTFLLGPGSFVYNYSTSISGVQHSTPVIKPPAIDSFVTTNSNFSTSPYTMTAKQATGFRQSIGVLYTSGTARAVDTAWTFIATQRWGIPVPGQGVMSFTWILSGGGAVTGVLTSTGGGTTNSSSGSISVFNMLQPVQLVSLSGRFVEQNVHLNWRTATEINTYKFDVERSLNGIDFQVVGSIESQGSGNTPHDYTFVDESIGLSSEYWYRLSTVDRDGSVSKSRSIKVSRSMFVGTPRLYAAYPNPFNPQTTVQFMIPNEQTVTISLYDEGGREVMRLVDNEALPTGYYSRTLSGTQLASGKYLLRLVAGGYAETQNLLVQK